MLNFRFEMTQDNVKDEFDCSEDEAPKDKHPAVPNIIIDIDTTTCLHYKNQYNILAQAIQDIKNILKEYR